MKTETCTNPKRCAVTIPGVWGDWGKWSECSVKCGGGFREMTRPCLYPGILRMKGTTEPFDDEYDSKMPCQGEGIKT